MQYLAKVRDGSEGVLANGYWTCQVLGVEGDKLIPLYRHLYSSLAPDFRSENHEIFKAIQFVSHFTHTKGTWVIDRGGDRIALFDYFLDHARDFIIRLRGCLQMRFWHFTSLLSMVLAKAKYIKASCV